jgi:hypothetical protein
VLLSLLANEILVFILHHPVASDDARHEADLLLQEMGLRADDQPESLAQRSNEEMIDAIVSQGSLVFT